ncbi:M24 family metallopeptidase [Frigidibacter sp. MR17.24]|uniref:M24 family metallopeptidase n=1 Tax=Frigidibacter sp. MR17.24 TaxID=3127345 RepID=UPI003012C1AB
MTVPVPVLPFERAEYDARLARTRRAMAAAGLEAVVIADPSNMYWLTGYDGWSFYVHQWVVLPLEEAPFWFGRPMDAAGALRTAWLPPDDVLSYPEACVQNPADHPATHLARALVARGLGQARIGVEMDNYYYTAAADAALRAGLPAARLQDATGLVNWQRAVKSPRELDYMRMAGRLVGAAHARILEVAEPGVPKSVVAAEIQKALITGVPGEAGDYTAIVPMLPSGADAAAPHLTWDARPMRAGEGTFFEIGGCYRRYHCPLSRTLFLGRPTDAFLRAEAATLEGMEAGLAAARPGNSCGDIARAYFAVLARHGIEKESRAGYAVGVSYPPDWGERTMSIRPDDTSVLAPGMTFHFMTGLWMADMGFEITETIAITETGHSLIADVPRRLFVKP